MDVKNKRRSRAKPKQDTRRATKGRERVDVGSMVDAQMCGTDDIERRIKLTENTRILYFKVIRRIRDGLDRTKNKRYEMRAFCR